MNCIKLPRRLFTGKHKQPQKTQKRRCPVLDLPVDLMLGISEYLPLCSQVFLSQTCRLLRQAFSHFRALIHIPDEERLEYLVDRVRNLPGRWLCEVCLQLHHAHVSDTPEHPGGVTCPLGWQGLRSRGYGLMSFRLDHRHVQLTLKYARMKDANNTHQQYLKALLAPVYASFTTQSGFPNMLHTGHAVYPKVVAGRYLLLSVYTYLENHTVVTKEAMGKLRICLHQGFAPGRTGLSRQHSTGLCYTTEAAFHDLGHEKCGFCPLCLTDFSVCVTPECAIICVWQDLGPEGSPLEPAWGTHTRAFRSRHYDVYVSHEPGSIRRFHDQGHGAIEFGSS
ncbi:Uncharacterized protein TPAR_00211 [Tolypocladium paradoxum]|uniref:F-box domain-containing protein n=1 Tax=Tolypocladium paradoxum TaxID=94208 RepID=A0A2S4LAY9_9HYPO|nr:Uncharacterized protein TPAR_00211 [Tolypocladium paradoxum]